MGHVKIQRNTYDLITHIDLEKIQYQIQQLKESVTSIQETCKQISCDPELPTLKDILDKVFGDFDSLSDVMGNRQKRSWNGAIQHIVKVIHGLINDDEMTRYEELIHKELVRDKIAMMQVLGKVSIVQNNITRQHKNLKELRKQMEKLKTSINGLSWGARKSTDELDKLKTDQHIQATASYGLTVHQEIQTILSTILFAKRNALHPKIISPKQLLNELLIATRYLPQNRHFPYALLSQNTEGIINLIDIKVFRINNLLVFVISNPLTVDEVYDLYKLIPFPVRIVNNQFVYIKPKENYLILNEQRTFFSLLPEIDRCKPIHPELFICQIDTPIFSRIKNRYCEVELLSKQAMNINDCDLRVINLQNEIWEKLHHFNTWVYIAPNDTELRIICPNETLEIPINNTGMLTLNSDCWAATPSVQLFPSPTQFKERFYSIIPKLNMTEVLAPYKTEITNYIKNNRETLSNSVQNFNDLRETGINIHLLMKDKTIVISNFNNYTVLIICVSASITCISVLLYCFFKKKRSPKVKQDKDVETPQETLTELKPNGGPVAPFEEIEL